MHTWRSGGEGWDTPLWPSANDPLADITRWHYHEATGLLESKGCGSFPAIFQRLYHCRNCITVRHPDIVPAPLLPKMKVQVFFQ
ncbi:MAG: hypothetical protein D3910_12825, partial [Candidatus Electrothrix sp. ATG2]|nr:hypothetical protein [Candidatus Electrothrix sp. ATG2]